MLKRVIAAYQRIARSARITGARLQRVIAAYHRVARSARIFGARRRSAFLSVLVLEERATPAGADSFLPPIHPPEVVLVATTPPAGVLIQPPIANASTANASVRSDLFGVGDAGKPEHANELEEMLVNDHASAKNAAGEMNADRQEIDAAAQAEDANAAETVIIEDMVYLPRLD